MAGKATAKQRAQHVVADFYKCNIVQFMQDPAAALRDAAQAGGIPLNPKAPGVGMQSGVGVSFFVPFAVPGHLIVQVETDGYVAIDCYLRGGNPKDIIRHLRTVLTPEYFDLMLIGRGITNMEELHGESTEGEFPAQQPESDVQEGETRSEEVGETGLSIGGPGASVEGPADRHPDPATA
jgi:hypothetical protein